MGKISEALDDKGGTGCAFVKIVRLLDDEDKGAVIASVAKGQSGYVIADALRAGGYKIAPSTVAMHIKKACKCF